MKVDTKLNGLTSTLMFLWTAGTLPNNVLGFSPLSISSPLQVFPSGNGFHTNNPQTRNLDFTTSDTSTCLMGIPKMFRWLTDQYPSINRQLNEGLNYNTVVDYFYLDMNGIIHPCTHGNSDTVIMLDETEMFKKIERSFHD